MELRSINTDDYFKVIKVIDEWWGGRKMTHLLPRLFFEHFQSTSFILEIDNELAGFIIGFISQTNNKEAYIHFVGVNPNYRKIGLAKKCTQLSLKM
ncbi:GNAT family N-acetyltransferase [Bacillus toyonensis]